MNVLGLKLPLLSVCYFHPDFSISSPWIPVYHLLPRLVDFKLWSLSDSQRQLVEMHIPVPNPQVLIWQAWELVLLTGASEAG